MIMDNNNISGNSKETRPNDQESIASSLIVEPANSSSESKDNDNTTERNSSNSSIIEVNIYESTKDAKNTIKRCFKSNNRAPAMIKYTAICLDSMLFPFIKIITL